MQAINRELLSVLSDATIRFVVPVYQRSYAWEKRHWERLWDDILAIAKEPDREHFTGSIVWVGKMQGPGLNSDGNVLVDGQQRLTTLSLIILAYAQYARANGNKGANGHELSVSWEEILQTGYLLSSFKKGEQRYKLTLSDADKDIFRALVEQLHSPATPLPVAESRLIDALEFFRTKIAGLANPALLWDGLQKLSIVNVTLDPQRDNPQLVFEAMNSTGKPLSHADLIRNYILLGLPIDEQTALYHNYWRQIELALGTDKELERFDKFIFHYLSMKKSPAIVNQSQGYQEFKDFKFQANFEAEALLQDMLFYAKIYASVANYQVDFDNNIAEILKSINILEADPVLPLVMYLYGKWQQHPDKFQRDEFVKSLMIIETYLAYRALCNLRNAGFNRYIPVVLAKFRGMFASGNFDVAKRLMATLEDTKGTAQEFPEKEAVIASLQRLKFYKLMPNRRRYFLERLENSEHPKNKLDIMTGVYSIEHIMPQKIDPATDWPEMLGDNYEEKHETYQHLLGNLTLTGYNSELSNMDFAKKKAKYLNTEPLSLLKSVINHDKWTFEIIEKRTAHMAQKLASLWHRPHLTKEEIEQFSLTRKDANKEESYISLKDMVNKGILEVDEPLVIPNSSIYTGFPCKVSSEGFLVFEDGYTADTPSGAVKHVMQKLGKPIIGTNGWTLWQVPRLRCKLCELKKFL